MDQSRYAPRPRTKRVSYAPPSIQDIESALQYLDPDMPHDDWVEIGMALKSELGDSGFDIFDSWSEVGSTYKPDDLKSTWRSIKPTGGVGIG